MYNDEEKEESEVQNIPHSLSDKTNTHHITTSFFKNQSDNILIDSISKYID